MSSFFLDVIFDLDAFFIFVSFILAFGKLTAAVNIKITSYHPHHYLSYHHKL